MENNQNDILTAIKVLVESKMYREAIELINSARIQTSLEESKIYPSGGRCIVCGDNRGHNGLQCPDFSSLNKQEWMKS